MPAEQVYYEPESGLPHRAAPAKCANRSCDFEGTVRIVGEHCTGCRNQQSAERARQQQRRGLERAS